MKKQYTFTTRILIHSSLFDKKKKKTNDRKGEPPVPSCWNYGLNLQQELSPRISWRRLTFTFLLCAEETEVCSAEGGKWTVVKMDEGRIYVRVTGKAISKKELEIYFQSRKQSGGGDISSIEQINDAESIITFEDQEGKFFYLSLLFT